MAKRIRKIYLIIGIGILVIFALLALSHFIFGSDKSASDVPNFFRSSASSDLPSCGDKTELFTVSPIRLEDFTDITPLGNLAPSAHTIPTIHLYFQIRKENPLDGDDGVAASVPVYATSDFVITEMSFTQALNREGYDDYVIRFKPCKEFRGYYDHVTSVTPEIKKAFDETFLGSCDEYTLYYNDGPINWKFCLKKVNIPIKAGQQIGTAGGGAGQRAFDFGAFDKRIEPHTFANPERWKRYASGELPYTVCALDYFTPELKSELKSRLGIQGVKRTAEPICGTIAQDIPGTSQGNWVMKGMGVVNDENNIIALVHDNLNPSIPVFSIGTGVKTIKFGAYAFTPKSSGLVNIDFSNVVPGSTYCYEKLSNQHVNSVSGIILVQMTSETEMKIEYQNKSFCGEGPWAFTKDADAFVR